MIPPLNGIRAFEAVARHRSFTRAAAELNVTQSAISHQVRNLEQFLGVKLFHRIGNELSLTDDGADLFPDIHEAMTLIRRSADRAQENAAGRPLGLWLRPHFSLKWLTPRLADFHALHPGFNLRLMHANESADFSDPAVDMSIEWLGAAAPRENARILVEGGLTPACSPTLLAQGPAVREPGDLSHHVLLHEADTTTWQEWLALAGVADLVPAGTHYFDDTNVRQQAAMLGQGFVLICPALAHDDIESGRLVCPLDIALETYNYHLVMPPSGQPGTAARKFSAWLFAQAGDA